MKFNMLAILAILAVSFTFTSCEEDAIKGCMNAEAENYDSTATEDDSSCVFTRDKFLGDYVGTLSCPGLLAGISNPDFQFIISENLSGVTNEVAIELVTLGATINGTVSGSTISINSVVPGFGFDLNADGTDETFVDLVVTGSADIDDAGMMTGTLQIDTELPPPFGAVSDTCSMSGAQQ